MPQLFICLQTLGPYCGSGEESEPIQASLPQFFMKHPWTVLTVWPGSQGNLIEMEKEARQFQQNAAILYQTSCIQTLWPDCGSGKESQPIQAECSNWLWNIRVHYTNLGTWQPGQLGGLYLGLPEAVSFCGPTFPKGSKATPAGRPWVLAPPGALASPGRMFLTWSGA